MSRYAPGYTGPMTTANDFVGQNNGGGQKGGFNGFGGQQSGGYQPTRQSFGGFGGFGMPQQGFGGFGMPQQGFGGFGMPQQGFGGFGGFGMPQQGFGGFGMPQQGFGGFGMPQQGFGGFGGFGGGFGMPQQGFGGFGGFNGFGGGFGMPQQGFGGFGMPRQRFNRQQQQPMTFPPAPQQPQVAMNSGGYNPNTGQFTPPAAGPLMPQPQPSGGQTFRRSDEGIPLSMQLGADSAPMQPQMRTQPPAPMGMNMGDSVGQAPTMQPVGQEDPRLQAMRNMSMMRF